MSHDLKPQAWELSFKEDQGELHQKVNKNTVGFEKTCDDIAMIISLF